jgi:hypothetical protein
MRVWPQAGASKAQKPLSKGGTQLWTASSYFACRLTKMCLCMIVYRVEVLGV